MPPVKKPKISKKSKSSVKEENKEHLNESVVSGQLQKKINKKQSKPPKDPKGVVFIKNLPHGFFEEQLKSYFEQFGDVTRVRLARSKRTGNSKGYAFVEFEYPEVAEVAAETMDNYLMFKQIVKASYIPPEKQQFNYFRTSVKKIRNKAGKLIWVSKKTAAIQQKVKKQNDWSEENYQKRTRKAMMKLKKIGEKYAHLGIDINKITVQPRTLTETEKKQQEATKHLVITEQKTDVNSKSVKRKNPKNSVLSKKQCTQKNKVSLEDLLGNTLQEDSSDEDYVAISDTENCTEESEQSTDEETYGFDKDSINENVTEMKALPTLKNSKKLEKTPNVERSGQLLKRKPHSGGIQKLNKPLKKTSVGTKKAALQIAAAKQLAKPLPKNKVKTISPVKAKKNLVKAK